MTFVVDTERNLKGKEKPSTWRLKTHDSLSGAQGWYMLDFKKLIGVETLHSDAFVIYNFSSIETNFSSIDLTQLASKLSESSFEEMWNKEDDEYWESYL